MSKKQTATASKLDPAQREFYSHAIERAAARATTHRGITLSLKFKQHDIDAWRAAAGAADKSLTDWVEENLNKAAERSQK